jgi:hypothetical protein
MISVLQKLLQLQSTKVGTDCVWAIFAAGNVNVFFYEPSSSLPSFSPPSVILRYEDNAILGERESVAVDRN